MMLIKICIAITVFALVFLFINCGGNGNPDQNQGTSSGTNVSTALKGNAAEGQKYFAQTCSACHGKDGKGLPKLGKDLTTSSFVTEESDSKLLDFLKQGRLATDPLNTTGVAMPPKGGNPAFNDQQLIDIISYVREIHQ